MAGEQATSKWRPTLQIVHVIRPWEEHSCTQATHRVGRAREIETIRLLNVIALIACGIFLRRWQQQRMRRRLAKVTWQWHHLSTQLSSLPNAIASLHSHQQAERRAVPADQEKAFLTNREERVKLDTAASMPSGVLGQPVRPEQNLATALSLGPFLNMLCMWDRPGGSNRQLVAAIRWQLATSRPRQALTLCNGGSAAQTTLAKTAGE